MDTHGFYTENGLALAAKLSAGTALTITKIVAGSAQTSAASNKLEAEQQALAVNTPSTNGNTAVIAATLTAASSAEDYALTEVGVYAQDPDEGEILYKIYRLSAPVEVTAGSRTVLRFYLEETVSENADITVSCSPAGLLTETDFNPVRERVELAGSVSQNTYNVAAAELQAFLDAQPRFLMENMILNITGTLTEPLTIDGFHGPGTIRIAAASLGDCIIRNKISLFNCSVCVQFWNLQIEAPAGLATNSGLIYAENCRGVRLAGCVLIGNSQSSGLRAINATRFSSVSLDGCTVKQFNVAVFAGHMSLVTVNSTTADAFAGNTTGALVWVGGIVLLAGSTPSTLGGNSNGKSGGIIAAANGSLL